MRHFKKSQYFFYAICVYHKEEGLVEKSKTATSYTLRYDQSQSNKRYN